MSEEEKISAPAGSTGLMRFYDASYSKVPVDPRIVIGICVGLIVVEIALHTIVR